MHLLFEHELISNLMFQSWRHVDRGFIVDLAACANPTFYPAGVHTINYMVTYSGTITTRYTDKSLSFCLPLSVSHSVRLNPADLFNHPGALRQDPVKGDSLNFSCPASLIPPSLCLLFPSVSQYWPNTDVGRWERTWKAVFLYCSNVVVYIL